MNLLLSSTEYSVALGSIYGEKYLRILIFRSFNDYKRKKKQKQIMEDMQMLQEDNLKSLLYLLHEDDINELFTMIEINRRPCRFDICFELLIKY